MKEEIVLSYVALRRFNLLFASEKIVCEVSGQASWDYFVGINKIVDHGAMNLISQDSFVPGESFPIQE